MPQPYNWWRIVRRSERLSWPLKGAWDIVREHDNPKTGEGCWAATATLAAEIGVPPRTLEGQFQELKALGLLRVERRGRRFHRWVMLPEPCLPPDTPSPRELEQAARLLDAALPDPRPNGERSRPAAAPAALEAIETTPVAVPNWRTILRPGTESPTS